MKHTKQKNWNNLVVQWKSTPPPPPPLDKTYTGCPKKAERWIFNTLRAKNVIFLTSLDKASSAEENDTKIIKFGWVIWNLCPLLEIQSFSNFAWFLRPMSEELCRDKWYWSVATKETRINGLPQNTVWKALPFTISSVKKYDIFSSQGTENLPFRFFWTPGIHKWIINHNPIARP